METEEKGKLLHHRVLIPSVSNFKNVSAELLDKCRTEKILTGEDINDINNEGVQRLFDVIGAKECAEIIKFVQILRNDGMQQQCEELLNEFDQILSQCCENSFDQTKSSDPIEDVIPLRRCRLRYFILVMTICLILLSIGFGLGLWGILKKSEEDASIDSVTTLLPP